MFKKTWLSVSTYQPWKNKYSPAGVPTYFVNTKNEYPNEEYWRRFSNYKKYLEKLNTSLQKTEEIQVLHLSSPLCFLH